MSKIPKQSNNIFYKIKEFPKYHNKICTKILKPNISNAFLFLFITFQSPWNPKTYYILD